MSGNGDDNNEKNVVRSSSSSSMRRRGGGRTSSFLVVVAAVLIAATTTTRTADDRRRGDGGFGFGFGVVVVGAFSPPTTTAKNGPNAAFDQRRRRMTGFGVVSRRKNRRGATTSSPSTTTTTGLFSTTKSPNGRVNEKEGALEALETLLEKQKAEVRETEDLIRRLAEIGSAAAAASSSAAAAAAGDAADGEASVDGDENNDVGSLLSSSGLGSSILSGVDYGFVSRSEGCKFEDIIGGTITTTTSSGSNETTAAFDEYYGPPANIIKLGTQQFARNLDAIRGEYKDELGVDLTPKQRRLQRKLSSLTLNSTAIWERERSRGPITAPLVIKIPYLVLCYLLDVVFEGRYPPSRFFLLETVARMPYFSYISMLHFYETVGFWRRSSDVKRVHFAEEWNEYHHLLIMESLGGDQRWWVRFMAQHSALVYNAVLTVLFALSPTLSYKFSELLETHAVDTYGQFLDENEEVLKSLPPTLAAISYYSYGSTDPLFGEYQTTAAATGREIRRPGENMKSLYDVFTAIRNDEGDHVSTMKACLDPAVAVNSPSVEKKVLTAVAFAAAFGYLISTGEVLDVDLGGVDGIDGLVDAAASGAGADDATALAIGSVLDKIADLLDVDEGEGGAALLDGFGGFDLAELLGFGAGLGAALWGQIRNVLIDLLEFLTKL